MAATRRLFNADEAGAIELLDIDASAEATRELEQCANDLETGMLS